MKKLFIVLAMGVVMTTGAFAQLTFGVTGVQYFYKDANGNLPTISEAWNNLKDGQGVYYGGFIEIIGKNMGLGASFNYDPIQSTVNSALDEMSYDVNIYLSYHLFGGRAFLDPFAQIGIGMFAFNYKDPTAANSYYESYYIYNFVDKDDPIAGSLYWDAGLGLGINLGPVGVFIKGIYNMNIKGVLKGKDDLTGTSYEIPEYRPAPFKWVFGAKLIL